MSDRRYTDEEAIEFIRNWNKAAYARRDAEQQNGRR